MTEMATENDPVQDPGSPYLGWPDRARLSLGNQLALGFFWLPNNLLWTGLILIVMPARVLALVGAQHSTGVLSWTTYLGAAAAIIVAPVFGAISDGWRSRMGRRRPLMALAALPSLAGILILVGAPTLAWFVVGLLAVQIFGNIVQASYQGLIPDLVPHRQRGTASGMMALYNQLGVIGGGLIAGFLSPFLFAWSSLGVMAAGFGVTFGLVKEPPSLDAKRKPWAEVFRSFFLRGSHYQDFRWVFSTRLLVMIGLYVLETYLFYYLHFVLGIANPGREVTYVLLILSFTAVFSSILAGVISDRVNRRRIIVSVSGVVMGICALLFVFSHTMTMVYVAAIAFGIGYGAYQSVDWALAVDTMPAGAAAKDMGVWSITVTLGQLLASLFGTFLAFAIIPALGTIATYRLMFGSTALLFLIGSALIWRVRRVA